jgi:hypothetical protein
MDKPGLGLRFEMMFCRRMNTMTCSKRRKQMRTGRQQLMRKMEMMKRRLISVSSIKPNGL